MGIQMVGIFRLVCSLILIIFALSCSGGNSASDLDKSEDELDELRYLVNKYCPEAVDEQDSYKKILIFRDHIHWVNDVRNYGATVPFKAKYYEQTIRGIKGNFCKGVSILLAAFLEAYGYTWQHVELWSNNYNEDGVPITHSVLNIWINGNWELHDTTYNCLVLDNLEMDHQGFSVKNHMTILIWKSTNPILMN